MAVWWWGICVLCTGAELNGPILITVHEQMTIRTSCDMALLHPWGRSLQICAGGSRFWRLQIFIWTILFSGSTYMWIYAKWKLSSCNSRITDGHYAHKCQPLARVLNFKWAYRLQHRVIFVTLPRKWKLKPLSWLISAPPKSHILAPHSQALYDDPKFLAYVKSQL